MGFPLTAETSKLAIAVMKAVNESNCSASEVASVLRSFADATYSRATSVVFPPEDFELYENFRPEDY